MSSTTTKTLMAGAVLLPLLAGCGSQSSVSATPAAAGPTIAVASPNGAATKKASASPSQSPSSAAPASPASTANSESPAPVPMPSTTVSVPTTPAKAPGGGSVHQTVPPKKVETLKPVPPGQKAKASQTIDVEVTAVKAITLKATIPGDISGPAVEVDVRITNNGSDAFPLDAVAVTVTGPGNVPGESQQSAPAKPFQGSLAGGASADGVYVFRMAKDKQVGLHVEVSANPSLPVVSVNGSAK